MKSLFATAWLPVLLLALPVACKGDDDAASDINTAGTNSLLPAVPIVGALGPNSPPALGARIDRAGRPAITAALIGTFNPDLDARDAERDRYNASGIGNPAFLPGMQTSLGVLDALDNECGNQLLEAAGDTPYAALAGVLLDDQVYVNSAAQSSGTVYLGVEAEAVGALPPGQGAAGGRAPNEDVIERSYSVLALGALRGFDDGISTDDATHDPNTFPFIAASRP